jgi:hypothetical protein
MIVTLGKGQFKIFQDISRYFKIVYAQHCPTLCLILHPSVHGCQAAHLRSQMPQLTQRLQQLGDSVGTTGATTWSKWRDIGLDL